MTNATTVVPLSNLRLPVGMGVGVTHRGMVRERNEDALLTDPSGKLWAVADGMGGYGHGDVASDIVIDCLAQISDDQDPPSALMTELARANRLVLAKAAEPGMGQMGATVVAMMLARARAYLAWLGDCRGYLLRGWQLRLLTRDHTVVQDLVDQGAIDRGAAERHPESHVVTRAVGGAAELEPELVTVPVFAGDRLLLCSDGLTRAIYETVIADLLAAYPDPAEAARALLRAALDAGAPDNVSAIVVAIHEG